MVTIATSDQTRIVAIKTIRGGSLVVIRTNEIVCFIDDSLMRLFGIIANFNQFSIVGRYLDTMTFR